LTDYGKLKPIAGTDAKMYTAPDALTNLKKYRY